MSQNLERSGEVSDSGSASTINIFQPANQIFHFSGGYIFKRTRASAQSCSSNCAGLSIFNVPRDNILNVLGQYLLFTFTKSIGLY